MADLDPHDPRNPRVPINCPRCAVSLTYLGTFPEPTRAWPWEDLSRQILAPDNTHVYACIDHGQFWLTNAVELKAAPKDHTSLPGSDVVAGGFERLLRKL